MNKTKGPPKRDRFTRKHKIRKLLSGRALLDKGWVIANHILVSFHVAFISSVLSIPVAISERGEVLKYMFRSTETIISCIFWYMTFHIGIAIHEMGHYIKAVKINALNQELLPEAQAKTEQNALKKTFWYLKMFITIPWGKFTGVSKTGLDYHPDAPYNLAVSAAGPSTSRNLSMVALPIAILLLVYGLGTHHEIIVYMARLILGIGVVGLLDFFIADPGKYREFKQREYVAAQKAKRVAESATIESWTNQVQRVKDMMVHTRMLNLTLPDGRIVSVPWEYRNCGMGGRHTEKEFPESNISLQESMYIPLSTMNYEDAQEMTVNLQTRLKEIIENEEGCTVKGIGTEGGIAAYIKKEETDTLPVQRLWRMQKQAIIDCGYIPGKDVAMAIDPAVSECQNTYREKTGLSDAVGTYLAWRDKEQRILSRDDLLEIYRKAIEDEDIPIVSIEDGFAEDDDEGWKLLMENLGDKIIVIGDDSVTTKDSSIEYAADEGLNNAALIKLNQIGSVCEGILAMLTAIGKKLQIVVSHRSKSPIEDFEAQTALAAKTMGLKCGGGSNSERVYKYEAVSKVIREAVQQKEAVSEKEAVQITEKFIEELTITEIVAREASTNTGIPTVGIEVKAGIPGSKDYGKLLVCEGATPLGTSAGTDEAIHLIDSIIEKSPTVEKYSDLFVKQPDKTFVFQEDVKQETIENKNDEALSELWRRTKRYGGKGCLNAVDNANKILSKAFIGKKISEIGDIVEIDKTLLMIEKDIAIERGKLPSNASKEEQIAAMQRKANMGMNAILSLSLSLARLKGAIQSKALWEVMREVMIRTMASTIVANGGLEIADTLEERIIAHEIKNAKIVKGESLTQTDEEKIKTDVAKRIRDLRSAAEGQKEEKLRKVFCEKLSFDDLAVGLQIINEKKEQGVKLYKLLRDQMLVYPS